MQTSTFRQLVWDYNLTQDNFEAILAGQKQLGSLDQSWAIARVLENVPYYEALNLVSPNLIKANWEHIKPKLFNSIIKHGYEYILYHPTLSITG